MEFHEPLGLLQQVLSMWWATVNSELANFQRNESFITCKQKPNEKVYSIDSLE